MKLFATTLVLLVASATAMPQGFFNPKKIRPRIIACSASNDNTKALFECAFKLNEEPKDFCAEASSGGVGEAIRNKIKEKLAGNPDKKAEFEQKASGKLCSVSATPDECQTAFLAIEHTPVRSTVDEMIPFLTQYMPSEFGACVEVLNGVQAKYPNSSDEVAACDQKNMKQCIAKTMIGLKLENCASENDSVDLTTLQETVKCIKGEADVEIF